MKYELQLLADREQWTLFPRFLSSNRRKKVSKHVATIWDFSSISPNRTSECCKYTRQGCLCFFCSLENVFLHAWDGSLSFVLAAPLPGPAGNSQPWVWNVFTFGACYKLSAKTNFAWLGRGLHLAQMLFGSTVFQGLALSIGLSLSDGVPQARCEPGRKVTLVIRTGVCVRLCTCTTAKSNGRQSLPILLTIFVLLNICNIGNKCGMFVVWI